MTKDWYLWHSVYDVDDVFLMAKYAEAMQKCEMCVRWMSDVCRSLIYYAGRSFNRRRPASNCHHLPITFMIYCL